MEDQLSLLQPLIPITSTTSFTSGSTDATTISLSFSTTATSCLTHHLRSCDQNNNSTSSIEGFVCSNSGIIIRLLAVLLAAAISIWANYEASKIFEITVINSAKETPAGQRFTLFYDSNDKAIRMALDNSVLIEKLLYPNVNLTKKHINHVTLRLASHNLNLTATTSTAFYRNSDESLDYVIDLSPSLLEGSIVNHAMELAIQRAMARMWLWDGDSKAPTSLIDGMIEYITDSIAGVKFSGELGSIAAPCKDIWWEDANPRLVANMLHNCEGHRKGFIQRLNQAMKETWHDRVIDDVLGMTTQLLCDPSYKSSSPGFLHISSS